MTGPLLCLSVQEPWASAILKAGKDIENRNWQNAPGLVKQARNLIGQRVAIHASQKYDTWGAGAIRRLSGHHITKAECTLGAVIGVVTLRAVDDWSPSPWYVEGQLALRLSDAYTLDTPIPYKGALGFFRLDEQVQERVRRQLAYQGVTA